MDILNHRIYLDNVSEILSSFQNVTEPPRFVIHTPMLFNAWLDWANTEEFKERRTKSNTMKPMGELVKPDWLEYKFDNLEKFYQYFQNLMFKEN